MNDVPRHHHFMHECCLLVFGMVAGAIAGGGTALYFLFR